jgi:hypothetical protein
MVRPAMIRTDRMVMGFFISTLAARLSISWAALS